jgi:hypothetical protein
MVARAAATMSLNMDTAVGKSAILPVGTHPGTADRRHIDSTERRQRVVLQKR